MSEEQEKRLRKYCAHVLTEYGFEFSPHDPIVPALYTIYQELASNKIGNEDVAKTLKIALEKLNPTVYNFDAKGEAWKFKLAESLRWLFIGLSAALAVLVGLIWWRQYYDVGRAKEILLTSTGVHRMLMLAAEKDEAGFMYLEFPKAKGKFIKNFIEYDEIKRDTVRVYLGKVE